MSVLRTVLWMALAAYAFVLMLLSAFHFVDGYAHAQERIGLHTNNSALCRSHPSLESGHHAACADDHAHSRMSPVVFALRCVGTEFTLCPPDGCTALVERLTWTTGVAGAFIVGGLVVAYFVVFMLLRARHALGTPTQDSRLGWEEDTALPGLRRRTPHVRLIEE